MRFTNIYMHKLHKLIKISNKFVTVAAASFDMCHSDTLIIVNGWREAGLGNRRLMVEAWRQCEEGRKVQWALLHISR